LKKLQEVEAELNATHAKLQKKNVSIAELTSQRDSMTKELNSALANKKTVEEDYENITDRLNRIQGSLPEKIAQAKEPLEKELAFLKERLKRAQAPLGSQSSEINQDIQDTVKRVKVFIDEKPPIQSSRKIVDDNEIKKFYYRDDTLLLLKFSKIIYMIKIFVSTLDISAF